jgi:hypothetical protein
MWPFHRLFDRKVLRHLKFQIFAEAQRTWFQKMRCLGVLLEVLYI